MLLYGALFILIEGEPAERSKERRPRRADIWTKRELRRAQSFITLSNYHSKKVEEAARYLMIANGAVLVASISASGAIFKEQEHVLASILAEAVSYCVTGFFQAAVAYVFATNFSVSLQKTKQEVLSSGFHVEARRLWRNATHLLLFVAGWGMSSLLYLMSAGYFAAGALRKAAGG